MSYLVQEETMKIISVANLKGGVGKTTTASYLAHCLNLVNQNVLVVDTDPQANASSMYGVDFQFMQKYNLMTALENKKQLNKCIAKVSDRLGIIPATIKLADFESNFASEYGKELLLKDLLSASLPYDYIIIDTPPNFGIITRNVLFASDICIIPVDPHLWSLEGGMKLVENIDAIRKSVLKKDLDIKQIYILPIKQKTIFAAHEKNLLEAIETHFKGFPVLPAISNYDDLKKHQSGRVLMKGKIVKEYMTIMEKVTNGKNQRRKARC
jgi:chromosome partitioning protein